MSDGGRPFAPARGGARVALKVTPKARRRHIGAATTEADGAVVLKVAVTAPPERGKANDAVIAMLAKAWGVPKSTISVTAGAGGRRKTLHIAGDPEALITKLEQWARDRHD